MSSMLKSTGYSSSSDRRTGADALGALMGLLLLVAAAGCSDSPEATPAAGGDPSGAGATLIQPTPPAPPFTPISSTLAAPLPPFTPTSSAPSSVPTASGAGSPGDPPGAGPTNSTARTAPPADEPSDRPVYAAVDGAVVEGGEIGTIFNLADVRVGRHDGYTRIVWEMEEAEGRPYHRVVTRVREDGSPVQPFGRHWLEVSISDVYAWTRPELLESRTVALDGAVTVLQQLMIGDDAIYAVGVGLAGPVRFELSLLESPVRLVLDVFDGR